MSKQMIAAVAVGDEIGELTVHVERGDLVRYAGASGDFNPIHWNERVAKAVGLDDVIAHGMFTMALGGRLVSDWAGDPARVVDYQVRFTRPVLVPDPAGVDVVIAGKVRAVDSDAQTAEIDIAVTVADKKVLGKARAIVTLAP